MKNEQNVPQVRFKGFTDAWEQRKVIDLLELLTDYDANGSFADMAENVHTSDGEGFAWYVRTTDLENPKPLSELKYVDESSYKFLKKTELHGGELLMAKRGDIGKVYIFEPRTSYATVAPNMYLLKLNNLIFPHFLYYHFISNEGNKKLTRLNSSSTLGALYKDDVKNIKVKIPSIEEQAKIGNYFKVFDNLITLHQRKCETLQKLKKSMLQKMFPKNGSLYPEIRFAGFTDAWEQRELGEVTEDFVEKSTVENQYPVLTSSQQKGIVLQDDYFAGDRVSQSGNLGYFIIPRGYFAYRSRSDNDVFVFNRNDCVDMGIISYFYPVFKPKNVDSDFLLRRLNNGLETQLRISSEGTGQHVLSLKKFKNMTTLFPTISEQQKIGAYFKSLDNLITLHQRKLETLKKMKKSMLQKMFI